MNKKYWPFVIVSPEQLTEQHQLEMRFLEIAHQGGYNPYTFGDGSFGTQSHKGRVAEIIHRGANAYWEVILSSPDKEVVSVFIEGFEFAAELVLRWLQGEGIEVIRRNQKGIVSRPGVHGW